LRLTKTLRFWVECAFDDRQERDAVGKRTRLIASILRDFEEAGDAMRYLHADGRIAWKATPQMLSRLADAEQDAEDEFSDWP
jgi:hypothetical protein